MTTHALLISSVPADADWLRGALQTAPPDSASRAQIEIEAAASIDAAAARLAAHGVDVILLILPQLHERALERIRDVRAHAPDVPVIVLSDDASEEQGLRAVAAGAHDCLVRGLIHGGVITRVLRAAVERHRAEMRYDTVVRSTLDGFWLVDGTGRILDVNDAYCEMTGFARDALVGMRVSDVEARETPQQVAEHIALVVAKGAQRFETVHRRRDGGTVELEASVTRLPAEEILLCAFFRDISARKRAEHALVESARLLNGTLDALSAQIAILDAQGTVLSVNESWRRAVRTGRAPAPECTVGMNLVEVCAAAATAGSAGAEQLLQGVRDVLARRCELFAMEQRDTTGGVERWYQLRVTHFTTAGEERVVVEREDISTRRRAEDALQRTAESLRSFVENSPYGIYRSAGDRFLTVNRALVQMLGYESEEQLLAADIRHIYQDPAERDQLIAQHRSASLVHSADVVWKRRDGTPITVRLRVAQIHGPDGTWRYWEGFVEDVTPLRAAERALRESEKLAAVGQLVSGVAHELNNPLAAILHFVEDLLTDQRSTSDAEALTVIRDQAQRSRAIVRDLLAFARNREEQREQLNALGVLERCARALQPVVEAHGATLHVLLANDLPVVEIDRAGIEQVITNLVANAAHAAGQGGTVTLRAHRQGTVCEVLVEDTGPGLSDDLLPRIFEPFFTTKPTGEGTGLGLSVSLGIVQQHGGTISAENISHTSGHGARFVVRLPAAEVDAAAAPASAPASTRTPERDEPRGSESERPRVLLVDDEDSIRSALRRYFTRRGWDVMEASDGEAALAILSTPGAARDFAVIIADLRMPGVSGIELHDRLLAASPEILDRVILSTGDVASAEARTFIARTRCTVLEKPFALSTLDETVSRLRARDASPRATAPAA
ncbi:MAG TPA: PAS domain S-box protein [Gemmatimonadaceae bacterium]|nr:PAS domain S-box protein [Gemmatimonadaceae bacterium]